MAECLRRDFGFRNHHQDAEGEDVVHLFVFDVRGEVAADACLRQDRERLLFQGGDDLSIEQRGFSGARGSVEQDHTFGQNQSEKVASLAVAPVEVLPIAPLIRAGSNVRIISHAASLPYLCDALWFLISGALAVGGLPLFAEFGDKLLCAPPEDIDLRVLEILL